MDSKTGITPQPTIARGDTRIAVFVVFLPLVLLFATTVVQAAGRMGHPVAQTAAAEARDPDLIDAERSRALRMLKACEEDARAGRPRVLRTEDAHFLRRVVANPRL